MSYAIEILNNQLASENYDLTWAIEQGDEELAESYKNHISSIESAIKILSNERRNEQYERVCPKCGTDDVIWTLYCNNCNESM